MEVYVVLRGIAYEGSEIVEIFDSLELANNEAQKLAETKGLDWSGSGLKKTFDIDGGIEFKNSSGDTYYVQSWQVSEAKAR